MRLPLSGQRDNERARHSRYHKAIPPPTDTLIAVANAAPMTPLPSGKINNQSSNTLSNAEITLHHIASFGAPSKRITKSPTAVHIWKTSAGVNHNR